MKREAVPAGEVLVRGAIPSSDIVRDRFGAVDGLRALAIVACVAYEVLRLDPGLAAANPLLTRVGADAGQGLTLFLVLSGFALAYPAIVALTENGRAYLDIGRFAVKRILRIYPAFLLAIALTVVVPPLAVRYGLPPLAGAAASLTAGAAGSLSAGAAASLAGGTAIPLDAVWRSALFAGDGLGNDGFLALGLLARCYVAFPLVLWLWWRSRRIFGCVALAAAVLDTTTGLHAFGLGALVPFMFGIVAADLRAQHLPTYRFGIPLALLAGSAAVAYGPTLARLAAAHAPATALRVDPLWAIVAFAIVVSVGALPWLERIVALPPLRLLGATSFSISLIVVPVTAFAIRQLAPRFGARAAAIDATLASLVLGFALFQVVDRAFADGTRRRRAADAAGPVIDAVLALLRLDRVVLGRAPVPVAAVLDEPTVEASFYAPPPRPDPPDLAMLTTRTGSAQDLAEEMLAMKERLAERSAAFFGTAPAAPPAGPPPEKPGFYRRPAAAKAPNITTRLGAPITALMDAQHGR